MRRLALAVALAITFLGSWSGSVGAQAPVRCTTTVDARDLARTGRFRLELVFRPDQDVARPYSLRVEFRAGGARVLFRRDHTPPQPTVRWKKGDEIRYELPVSYPIDLNLRTEDVVEIFIGFYDPVSKETWPPTDASEVIDELGWVADLTVPAFEAVVDDARVDAILETANGFARTGRNADAWGVLESGLRLADADRLKFRLRDALLRLGRFAPKPLDFVEEQIVAGRIESERRRYLRLISGRLYDRGEFHGALRILESIGGSLAEDGEKAVIGALADADRNEKDRQDVKQRLLETITPEEKEQASRESKSLGPTAKLLEKARRYAKKGDYPLARQLLRELRFAEEAALRDEAYRVLQEVEKEFLAATPPAQAKLVDEAVNHPAWARTRVVPTHNFIFIGPETLVEGVPDDSRLRFDVAYVFITDLFGRVPNPEGDRVTVYFKELWDFGGGVGGGKTIDIGRADPNAKSYRVDGGLFYHEFTHCTDDTTPVFAGSREGLANFGAIFAEEVLGRANVARAGFASSRRAFEKDYLERDLEYWRIPNYGPSAGFFLHFADTYAKAGSGHDWAPYRRFFREYREAPVKDGREPFIARSMAHHLVRAFGPGAFDDFVRFRFPLIESDRAAVGAEIAHFGGLGDPIGVDFRSPETAGVVPNSPLPRDYGFERLTSRARSGLDVARAIGEEDLGIVYDWQVIGPFRAAGTDADACVFPPEYEIGFDKTYKVDANICRWQQPGANPPATLHPTGWVRFDYPYQDDSAIYALSHVSVPEARDAWAWLRADDDVSLFLNDELIGKYDDRGRNGSSWWGWRGPAANVPDAIRFPVRLRAGRNKVLVKIKNRGGPAGFVFSVTARDGRPFSDLTADTETPAAPPPAGDEGRAKKLLRLQFDGNGYRSRVDVTAGRFDVRRKALEGIADDGRVAWRKYTVRPGFPKDSPSNLLWLKAKTTAKVEDFELTLDVSTGNGRPPKLGVAFQGEGEDDGLSGWTLILHPAGDKLAMRLERYDRLVYQAPPVEVPAGEAPVPLLVRYHGGRVTVRFGAATLLDERSIRAIPGRHRIGLMTWGPGTRFHVLDLKRFE